MRRASDGIIYVLSLGHSDIEDLKKITAIIKNIKGVKRVAVNIWTGEPYYNYSKTLNQVDIAKVDDNGRS